MRVELKRDEAPADCDERPHSLPSARPEEAAPDPAMMQAQAMRSAAPTAARPIGRAGLRVVAQGERRGNVDGLKRAGSRAMRVDRARRRNR
jgi:hypothetical protein